MFILFFHFLGLPCSRLISREIFETAQDLLPRFGIVYTSHFFKRICLFPSPTSIKTSQNSTQFPLQMVNCIAKLCYTASVCSALNDSSFMRIKTYHLVFEWEQFDEILKVNSIWHCPMWNKEKEKVVLQLRFAALSSFECDTS